MLAKNDSLQNSLRCLQHPVALFSIALLLLNDHVLKVFAPSWLTGKLSDFAGLFFFPFLVIASLSLLPGSGRLSKSRLGAVGFSLVGIWFLLIKINAPTNAASNDVLSALLGHRVALVPDPADAFALIMLWPAWRLWIQPKLTRPNQLAYFSLSVGVLACLASSPAIEVPRIEEVQDFINYKGVLYAVDSEQQPLLIAASRDTGYHWEILNEQELSNQVTSMISPQASQVVGCDPTEPNICYRIDMGSRVDGSIDRGKQWQTAWELPRERISYIERRTGGSTLRTYDLLIASENGKSVLFVALGKEGILRRELPDGSWERLGVGDAEPTPYAASTLQGAIGDVWRELTISIASAFLAMFLAGLIAWKSLHRTDLHILDWTDWGSWTILVIGVCLLVSIGLAFALWALSDSPDRIFPAFASYFFYPLFILILWTSAGKWGRRIAVDNDLARKLTTRFLSIAVGVCLLASMPWLLWTFGIIPTYGLALFIAVLLALGFAGVGYRQIWRFGRGVRLEVQP